MTGNSSNFTDANRRVSQPGLRLSGRGADRATMIEAVIGGLNHGVGRRKRMHGSHGGRNLTVVERGHQHQISI